MPLAAVIALSACGADAPPPQYGASPRLPEPTTELFPTMKIAEPAEWGTRGPSVPAGYTIRAIARDLKIPRQTLVLPNGDILVAEGQGGGAPKLTPKDVIAGFIKAQGFVLYRSWTHYAVAGGFAMLSATVAAWLPARKAARVNPVDIVRGAA